MSRKHKFAVGEKILCYHGPLIYEAKCLKAVKTDNENLIYFIHYVGWNKKWDEWIREEALLKCNKRNLNKQAKVKMAYMAQSRIRKSKKVTNLKHTTSKQDDQDGNNIQPSTSKDQQASYSDVSNKLCDQPDPAMETEKQMVKDEVNEKKFPPSTLVKGVSEEEEQKSPNNSSTDVTNMEFEEMQAYVNRSPEKLFSEEEGNNSANNSSTDVPDKEYDELHAYVNCTPEKYFSEEEGNNSASSSSTDVPDKDCDELHAYVNCTPEKYFSEGEGNNTASSSSTDVPNKECDELHAYVNRSPEKYISEGGGDNTASSSSTDVPNKECDELHACVNCTPEKYFSEGEGNNTASSSSTDVPNKECDELHAYVNRSPEKYFSEEEGNNSASSSSTDVPDKDCDELHAYVNCTPEKYFSEGEGNNTASSSSTDVPNKECDERHAYVNRSPEKYISEGGGDNTASNSSSNAPVKELTEPLPIVVCKSQVLLKTEITIELPDELKHFLVHDRELVRQQKKLVILPEKHNISDIFMAYLDHKCDTSPSIISREDAGREIFLGLEKYLTSILNTHLLYDIEQPQYNDVRSKSGNKSICRIYGGIHLLRLFVIVGPLLSYSPSMANENVVRKLTYHLEELLQYLLLKKSEYFGIEHYENASEEYLRRVQ